jgi:hypothetical protein
MGFSRVWVCFSLMWVLVSTPVENFPFVAGENCTLGQGDEP